MSSESSSSLIELHTVAEFFAITYWIPYTTGLVARSDLQSFPSGMLASAQVYERIASMPFDVRELNASRASVLVSRLRGLTRTRVLISEISVFEEAVKQRHAPFNVVVSVDGLGSKVAQAIASAGRDWLHLSTSRERQTIPLEEACDKLFVDFFRRVARAQTDPFLVRLLREFLDDPVRTWESLTADCPRHSHNVTSANELALDAFRISLQGREELKKAISPRVYAAASVQSVRSTDRVRKALVAGHGLPWHTNDLTLSVDSLGWGLSRAQMQLQLANAGASRREAHALQRVLDPADFGPEFDWGRESNGAAQALLSTCALEQRTVNAALALHSGLRLTPVLRLSPALNEVRPDLVDIGSCARGNGPHQDFKLSKLGRQVGERMAGALDTSVMSQLKGSAERINEVSIVADLPLEWLAIDGMPLALKHDVSRIPRNPGSVMLAHCAHSEISFVSRESFQEILIVRSFQSGDPIAGHLEHALSGSLGEPDAPSPTIRFVDVSTPSQFVSAVSDFTGSVLIFDGHGYRDSSTGVGSIVVGGRPLDVWGLRNELSFPPVVLLSACDTYPIDGSHGSSAIGMLALGARSVLGTLLPIHSIQSCTFLARLVYRIAALLPLAMRIQPSGVNWRFFMSGMLRMVYASEVIFLFAAYVRMDPEKRRKVQYDANSDINFRNPRWLERIHEGLAAASNLPVASVRAYCDKYAWITHALKYVQLGRPELIHVVETTPADSWAGAMADRRP